MRERKQIEKIYNFLYKNTTLYLVRKKIRFEKLIKRISIY